MCSSSGVTSIESVYSQGTVHAYLLLYTKWVLEKNENYIFISRKVERIINGMVLEKLII